MYRADKGPSFPNIFSVYRFSKTYIAFVNLIAKFLYIIFKNHTFRYSAMAVKIASTATKGDRETHMFLHIFNSGSS